MRGGRSVELKRNYRNTRQIAEAALSLLAHDLQQTDFSEHIVPEKEGPLPVIVYARSAQQQHGELLNILSNVDLTRESVVALHRTRRGADRLATILGHHKYQSTSITARSTQNIAPVGLYTCTMSSAKGLEFDHVVICDLNDTLIPHPASFSDDNDELHISTERRLLYTCMTRARSSLLLIATGTPSRYLREIDQSKVEVRTYAST